MDERLGRRWRLPKALLVAASIAAVIGLGAVAVLTQLDSARRVEQAQRDDRDALQTALSGLVGQYFNATFLATQTSANSEEWSFSPADAVRLKHVTMTSPLTSYGAALLTLQGAPVAAWTSAAALPPVTDPGYLPMRQHGLSDVMTSGTTSVVAFAVPVSRAGRPAGYLVTYADARTWALEGYHRSLRIAEGASPYVVDSRGVIAASADVTKIGSRLDGPTPTHTTEIGDAVISTGDGSHGWRAITIQDAALWSPGIEASRQRALIALAALLTLLSGLLVLFHHRQQVVARRLAHARLYDPLTGLAQRRLFEIRLDAALARHRRTGAPLAVLYCDLDGFKGINDTHGHNTGDRVLREVATRLAETVREDDFVVRLGGDEFAIILEATGSAEVQGLVPRLYEAVQHPVQCGAGREVRPLISIGGAVTHGGRTADELVHAADLAMYAVKSRGDATLELTDLLPGPRSTQELYR